MPYSNVPLGNLKLASDWSTPEITSTVTNPPTQAEVLQILTALRALGICKLSNEPEPDRHGPYDNIKLSDLDLGTYVYTYFQTIGENAVRPSKVQIELLCDALIAMGLCKETGAPDHKHGPYTNVSIKNLRRKLYNGNWVTPNISATGAISNPPTGTQYDNIIWVLRDLGLAGMNYRTVVTIAGDGTGILEVDTIARVNNDEFYVRHIQETMEMVLTPTIGDAVSVFEVNGNDKLADLVDVNEDGSVYTYSHPVDNTTKITINIEFDTP